VKLSEAEYAECLSKFSPEEQERLKNIKLPENFDFEIIRPEMCVCYNQDNSEEFYELEDDEEYEE